MRRRKPASRRVLRLFVGLVLFFLALPLAIVVPVSLSSSPYLQFPPPGLSFQWYERYLFSPEWIDATVRSLQVAAGTVVLTLLVAVPLAFALVRASFPGRALLDRLLLTPLIVPTIITAVAIYGIFSQLKLIGSLFGLVLAHAILALPFALIVLQAGFRGLDRSLETAAAGLGAGRFTIFRRIVLPQMRPSLVSAALLAFITSFDELVVAIFLAGTNSTLPKKMFENIRTEVDPTVAAVSVLQILMICLGLFLFSRYGRRRAGQKA
jgi:putative spermidine/putrescine transport system permease protein